MVKVTHESTSVQSYLTILQGIISRMAANSGSCKTWAITLVSAILVIVAEKGHPEYVWFASVPIVLFCLLDAYYLALENVFRAKYDNFIRKLHDDEASVDDVFILTPPAKAGRTIGEMGRAFFSFSVWPFYMLLAVMVLIVRYRVIQ